MWIYSHTNYTLKGYAHLNHEAIHFVLDEVREVTEEVGVQLLGTFPLQFCQVPEGSNFARKAGSVHRKPSPWGANRPL